MAGVSIFPMLDGEHSDFTKYIVETLVFSDASEIYVQGRNKQSIFGTPTFTSSVLVVRINCKV